MFKASSPADSGPNTRGKLFQIDRDLAETASKDALKGEQFLLNRLGDVGVRAISLGDRHTAALHGTRTSQCFHEGFSVA